MNTFQKADIVIHGDAVFTGLADKPQPASIAIVENTIAAIGNVKEIEALIGADTRVFHFEDQLIMPGFHDFHLHVIPGSIQIDSVDLTEACSIEETIDMVRRFAEERPNDPWIIGFSWDNGKWVDNELPHRAALDKVFPDRPVVLNHVECHYCWVNSKALEIMGIDEQTKNPAFGEIHKDGNGKLTGILFEKAMDMVHKGAYSFSREKIEQLLKGFLELAAGYGITSVNDMYAPSSEILDDFSLFEDFEKRGELTSRIHLLPALNGDLERARQLRDAYHSGQLQFSGLKQFIDGVITGYTAYMIEPYADDPENCGSTTYPAKTIKEWVAEADREGFRIRFHAIGDAAIRLALDAFEEAQKQNGKRDARHTIEHVEVIHPDDINRFQELGVIASMQPHHLAALEQEVYASRLGDGRNKRTFAINTLKNAGASLAFGSDFPVVSLNPMLEIYRAVSRVDSSGLPENMWNPEEKISLAEALRAYTYGPAYGTFREHELGTLEPGKLADIIALDRNLFSLPVEEILKAEVVLTIMDGSIVYQKKK